MRIAYKQLLIGIYGLILIIGGFFVGRHVATKHAAFFWPPQQIITTDQTTYTLALSGSHHPIMPTNTRPWMTVFVHGSFGLMLGLLSIPNVLQDKISGSTYRKINRGMRDDDYYFKDQIMLERGLVPIHPSFDTASTNHRPYAAYPSLKTYTLVAHALDPEDQPLCYTFGWSGLMSQNSRRFEAIRLYNALCQEVERLKERGIHPRIRLVAHSHGGNVCLNLAGLWSILNHPSFAQTGQQSSFSSDAYQNDALTHLYRLLLSLGSKEDATGKPGQKYLDYVPTNKDIQVEELIMFGTPIQPETEAFCKAGYFGTVYNFYSGEDIVQILDWVTSKKTSFSNQRLRVLQTPGISKDRRITRVVQAKIMLDNQSDQLPETSLQEEPEEDVVRRKRAHDLLQGTSLFAKRSKDPSHKELWFVQWRAQEYPPIPFLYPLPVVVLTPLLLSAIASMPDGSDLDINLLPEATTIQAVVHPHRQTKKIGSAQLDRSVIQQAQDAIAVWRPQDVNDIRDFQNAYKYLRN